MRLPAWSLVLPLVAGVLSAQTPTLVITRALRSATMNSAGLLRPGDRVGQIKEGYEADLILVEGNPLADIRALADVLVVISNGRVALNRTAFAR